MITKAKDDSREEWKKQRGIPLGVGTCNALPLVPGLNAHLRHACSMPAPGARVPCSEHVFAGINQQRCRQVYCFAFAPFPATC